MLSEGMNIRLHGSLLGNWLAYRMEQNSVFGTWPIESYLASGGAVLILCSLLGEINNKGMVSTVCVASSKG